MIKYIDKNTWFEIKVDDAKFTNYSNHIKTAILPRLYRDSTVTIYSKKLKFTVIKPCLMHDNSKVKILIYIIKK